MLPLLCGSLRYARDDVWCRGLNCMEDCFAALAIVAPDYDLNPHVIKRCDPLKLHLQFRIDVEPVDESCDTFAGYFLIFPR
jgi:hypothetical protein